MHSTESTYVSLRSAGSELCRYQRDVSFSLDIHSTQSYVAGGSETVCRSSWSGCFTELWAAPLTLDETKAGQLKKNCRQRQKSFLSFAWCYFYSQGVHTNTMNTSCSLTRVMQISQEQNVLSFRFERYFLCGSPVPFPVKMFQSLMQKCIIPKNVIESWPLVSENSWLFLKVKK